MARSYEQQEELNKQLDRLYGDPGVKLILTMVRDELMEALLTTPDSAKKQREYIFNKIRGVEHVVDFLKQHGNNIVLQKAREEAKTKVVVPSQTLRSTR